MLPRLAICAHAAPTLTETIALASERPGPVCVEYSFDPNDLTKALRDSDTMRELAAADIELRYHFPLGPLELANLDEEAGETALEHFMSAVEITARCGGQYMTVHAALHGGAHECAVFEQTKDRLGRLVEYGREAGVVVCLENLRWGLTSEPAHFIELVEAADSAVTLDVGHAVSSDTALTGLIGGAEFARMLAPRIVGAHVYDREDPHHIAPTDLDRIGDTLRVLLDESACRWWVIELFSADEIRTTRALLSGMLESDAAAQVSSGAES
ncbi:MAG: TIM barrel protein [Actinomycetes bacterium]